MLGKLADLCRKNPLVNTIAQYVYLNLLPALFPVSAQGQGGEDTLGDGKQNSSRVAFICDEMTWLDFKDQCQGIFLSPVTWREQLEAFRPELLFCESAWEGSICGWPDWRGRIYRNCGVWFENRRALLELLDDCRARGIPTVFWNKEDPTFWQHPRYDFTDTALRFDYIFTTAEECVPRYQALGHRRVFVLPFGVNTDLFSPAGYAPESGRVLFAGSWFGDIPQRCRDMSLLFDHVLEQGMQLDIYDRKSGSGGKNFRFPARYEPYIHPGVPYPELPALLGRYEYALNVNSVTDSRTMCSRRVLQMAACGMKIITNPSPAIEAMEGLRLLRRCGDGGILYFESDARRVAARYGTAQQFASVLNRVLGDRAVPERREIRSV